MICQEVLAKTKLLLQLEVQKDQKNDTLDCLTRSLSTIMGA